MNQDKQQRALQIWRKYIAEGERFINASQEYANDELDHCCLEVIPEVLSILRVSERLCVLKPLILQSIS